MPHHQSPKRPARIAKIAFLIRTPGNLIAVLLVMYLMISGCFRKEERNQSLIEEEKRRQTTGYVIGIDIGARLKKQTLSIDLQSVLQGIYDYYEDKELRFSMDSIYAIQKELQILAQSIESEMNRHREEAINFLELNKNKPNITQLSGIQYEILRDGDGSPGPSDSDYVTCHISCSLLNGNTIKNTWDNNSPEKFKILSSLPSISMVLKKMSVGSRYKIWIPPELAYGREGVPGSIPPYSLLVYEIELIKIN